MSILHAIRSCTLKVTTPLSRWRGAGGEALFILLLLASCQQQEDFNPPTEAETMGRIVLTLGSDDLYTEVETRATQTLTDISGYTFTLNGTTAQNVPVTNQTVTLTRIGQTNTFTGVVEAGTYTLTADNYADACTGTTGKPYYSGSSDDFTLAPATTEGVSIGLLTPKNAAVTYLLDGSFTALYNNPTITINYDGHAVTLTAPAANSSDLSTAVYCHVASTSATESIYNNNTQRTLSYTLSASAKGSSHVTDIVAIPGNVTVQSGRHTVITLTANSVTGEIIPIQANDHSGTFD